MHYTDLIEKGLNAFYALLPQKKPTTQAARKTRFIAHRGAHDATKGLIENTMAAFEKSQALGCNGIELDVRLSKDGEFIVHHDADLRRLFGKPQRIADLSSQQIKELAPAVPTLKEVVDQFGGQQTLFIELKTPVGNRVSHLHALLQNLTATQDYFLISLDEQILASLTPFPKQSRLLIPLHFNTGAFCRLCLQKDYGGVLGHFALLTKGKIQKLKKQGKTAGVGFVDSRNSLYREVQRDIPWLFTNRAEQVMPHLKALCDQGDKDQDSVA